MLSETLDESAVRAIESGEKADVVSVFKKLAYDEAEPEIKESFDEAVYKQVEEKVKTAIRTKIETEVDKQLAVYGGSVPDDVRQKAIDEAYSDAMESNYDDAVSKAFDEAKKSDDYKNNLADVTSEVHKEIDKEI